MRDLLLNAERADVTGTSVARASAEALELGAYCNGVSACAQSSRGNQIRNAISLPFQLEVIWFEAALRGFSMSRTRPRRAAYST